MLMYLNLILIETQRIIAEIIFILGWNDVFSYRNYILFSPVYNKKYRNNNIHKYLGTFL